MQFQIDQVDNDDKIEAKIRLRVSSYEGPEEEVDQIELWTAQMKLWKA